MRTVTAFILTALFFIASAPADVFAAQYDLKEMTPPVKKAIENRQARYAELQSLKASGGLGETNRGYVEAFRAGRAAELAAAENTDRRTIYRAIAEQNNLGSEGMPVIEQVFGQVQREKAAPGDRIQLPSGEWVSK